MLLIDDTDDFLRRELLYISTDTVKANVTERPEQQTLEMRLGVAGIQVDNQRRHTPFPVLLVSESAELQRSDIPSSLTLTAVKLMPDPDEQVSAAADIEPLVLESLVITIPPTVVWAEDRILARLLSFSKKLPSLYDAGTRDGGLSRLPPACLALRDPAARTGGL